MKKLIFILILLPIIFSLRSTETRYTPTKLRRYSPLNVSPAGTPINQPRGLARSTSLERIAESPTSEAENDEEVRKLTSQIRPITPISISSSPGSEYSSPELSAFSPASSTSDSGSDSDSDSESEHEQEQEDILLQGFTSWLNQQQNSPLFLFIKKFLDSKKTNLDLGIKSRLNDLELILNTDQMQYDEAQLPEVYQERILKWKKENSKSDALSKIANELLDMIDKYVKSIKD